MISLLAHAMTCAWFACGQAEEMVGEEERLGWAIKYNYMDETFFRKYLAAGHETYLQLFAGSFTHHLTEVEQLYTTGAVIAGAVVLALIIGYVTDMIVDADPEGREYKRRMSLLSGYMQQVQVPTEDRKSFRYFYRNFYKRKTVFGDIEKNMFTELPSKYFEKLRSSVVNDLVGKLKIFTALDHIENYEEIVIEFYEDMHPFLCPARSTIFSTGDLAREMYFLESGKLNLIMPGTKKGFEISTGEWFGEIPVLGLGGGIEHNQHEFDVRTATECDLWYLKKKDLDYICKMYPQVYKVLVRFAVNRRKRLKEGKQSNAFESNHIDVASPSSSNKPESLTDSSFDDKEFREHLEKMHSSMDKRFMNEISNINDSEKRLNAKMDSIRESENKELQLLLSIEKKIDAAFSNKGEEAEKQVNKRLTNLEDKVDSMNTKIGDIAEILSTLTSSHTLLPKEP